MTQCSQSVCFAISFVEPLFTRFQQGKRRRSVSLSEDLEAVLLRVKSLFRNGEAQTPLIGDAFERGCRRGLASDRSMVLDSKTPTRPVLGVNVSVGSLVVGE